MITTVTIIEDKVHDSFTNDQEIHFVAEGVKVSSADATPALTTAGHKELVRWNFGTIKNSAGIGLNVTGQTTGTFNNYGKIEGSEAVASHGAPVALINHGDIIGVDTDTSIGILLGASSYGPTI